MVFFLIKYEVLTAQGKISVSELLNDTDELLVTAPDSSLTTC